MQDLRRQLDWLASQGVPAEHSYADKKTATDFEREGLASVLTQLRSVNGKSWGRPREIDRTAVLEDLKGGMNVMNGAAKHSVGRATVFRVKAEAREG